MQLTWLPSINTPGLFIYRSDENYANVPINTSLAKYSSSFHFSLLPPSSPAHAQVIRLAGQGRRRSRRRKLICITRALPSIRILYTYAQVCTCTCVYIIIMHGGNFVVNEPTQRAEPQPLSCTGVAFTRLFFQREK